MPFALEITNPEGGRYTYDEDGLTAFDIKYLAALAALRALPGIHPSASVRDGKLLGRELDTVLVGTPVSIPSGFTFTIKEF